MSGLWDVLDRQLPGDEVWRHPGDTEFDQLLRREMSAAVDALAADGALVVWLTHPAIRSLDRGKVPSEPFPEWDPARMRRLNELVFELEALHPWQVRVIDLAGYMRTLPGGELDPAYRPDGVHLTVDAAVRLSEEWLGEELLRVYRDQAARVRAARAADPAR